MLDLNLLGQTKRAWTRKITLLGACFFQLQGTDTQYFRWSNRQFSWCLHRHRFPPFSPPFGEKSSILEPLRTMIFLIIFIRV